MPPVVTNSRRRHSRKNSPHHVPTIVAIVVLCVAGVFCAKYLKRPAGEPSAPKVELPAHQPIQSTESLTNLVPPQATTNLQPSISSTSSPSATNTFVKRPGTMQLPSGKVLTFPPPKEGEFRIVHSHGKMYKCDSEGNWEDVTPKPIFDNSFEECLVGLSVDGGSFIPGMLMGLDEDSVRKMLEKQIVINEDDGEDVVAKKEAVAQMKAVILDYMDGGGKFDDFVMEMYQFSAQERTLKGKGLKRLSELIREGNIDAARAYRDTYDEVLSKQGFSPLKLPKGLREALGEE